jgi:hypothetical protein
MAIIPEKSVLIGVWLNQMNFSVLCHLRCLHILDEQVIPYLKRARMLPSRITCGFLGDFTLACYTESIFSAGGTAMLPALCLWLITQRTNGNLNISAILGKGEERDRIQNVIRSAEISHARFFGNGNTKIDSRNLPVSAPRILKHQIWWGLV